MKRDSGRMPHIFNELEVSTTSLLGPNGVEPACRDDGESNNARDPFEGVNKPEARRDASKEGSLLLMSGAEAVTVGPMV